MANLIIIDTGYPNISRSGVQGGTINGVTSTGSAYLVNSGVRIPLMSVDCDWSRGKNSDDSAYPTFYDEAKINPSSVENPTITIKGIVRQKGTSLDKDNDGGSDDEILTLTMLDQLCTTPNVLCLYYGPVRSGETYVEATDSYRGLIKSLGDRYKADEHSTHEVPSNVPHVHVIAKGFRATESSKTNVLNYTLTLQLTA